VTSTVEHPLVPNLLPARTAAMTISTDAPATGATRPFGLTRATALAEGEGMVSIEGASYDPDRQLSVDPGGHPFVDALDVPHMPTSLDTQYDMTWVVDKD
jgi:putative ATP-grasp target RiPP